MRGLNIGKRLTAGFGAVILLTLIISGVGFWRMLAADASTHDITNVKLRTERLIASWDKMVAINGARSLAAAKAASPEVESFFTDAIEGTSARISALQDAIGERLADPQARRLFDSAIDARDEYRKARDAALQEKAAGRQDIADKFFNQDMARLIDVYSDRLGDLLVYQKELINTGAETLREENQLGMALVGGVTLLALLIGSLCAWLVTRSITRPLRHTVQLAQAVARRDLTQEIHPFGKDEVAELESALHRMQEDLRAAVGQMQAGAETIAAAASQISSGNLDLSSRTQQQSSSLEETAATMEQITSTVRQNADNALQANSLAGAARKTATDGGQIVSDMVGSMSQINAKSKQVVDIIGVIDSIAFQTNILALNAAVEAARAGEQGRGFAVVAAEVRALAQRSAASAKEIKTLIEASVLAAAQGNEQAASAGATMQEIVTSIQRVTDIMGEISAASQEQTTGIEQINVAVAQMDDTTRQNASLVDESAAAAASLEEQADALAKLVASFRLSGGAPGTLAASREPADTGRSSAARRQAIPVAEDSRNTHAAALAGTALAAPALAMSGGADDWTEF